ncbi:MAG: hypothetical protein ACRES7_12145, partial [Gammaproteobacteria bacterium]
MPALAQVSSINYENSDASSSLHATPLPAALRPALYQALAKDADAAQTLNTNGCATLPRTVLTACFNGSGAHFTGGGSSLALHLVNYGRGDNLASVETAKPVIKSNRVSYARGDLTEWWRVLPIGFEQGFTITKRPAGHGKLTLMLAASNKASQHDHMLGWGKLRYGGLVVTDAEGKVIPATLTNKGDRILIAVNDTHAIYPLTVDPLVWLEQKVSESYGAALDQFGFSVSLDGTTALVGTPQATVNGNQDQGAVYVFSESNGAWAQTQKLTASDGAEFDSFGTSVSLSGTTAIAGAPDATANGNSFEGAAYVFGESGGTWTQTAKLTSSDGESFDFFGHSVAVEGTTALVGADDATVGDNGAQGAVYAFEESDGSWSQTQKLTASDGAASDIFGYSIALDGSTVLIGAYAANGYQGSVYVFDESGGTWSQAQELTASDGAANDYFGYSIALDGSTALVGAWGTSVNGNDMQGAAYVFTESNGTWSQAQELTASDGAAFDEFGYSAALNGPIALVGADGVNGSQGAVYMFDESNGTWTQTRKLMASDGAVYDEFGSALVFRGTTALVGAWGATINGNGGQGAAYFEGESDLGLALSAPETVEPGQQYVSQTIATNNATAASPAVSATVSVPAAASFVSASATQGSCSEASGVVTCDFGQINGNAGTATANVTLKATGSSGTTIENTASVALATPPLTASAPTQIGQAGCPDGYTTYSGTLGPNATQRSASYEAPAGEENAILMAPAGFKL